LPDYETIYNDSAFQTSTAEVLPDNSANEISAQDMRDMYATLRDRNRVKCIAYTSTAALTLDLSVASVFHIYLNQNITSVAVRNEPSINLLYPSEDLDSGNFFVNTNADVSASNVVDPFGLSTADRLTIQATTNSSVKYPIPVLAGGVYTFNLYARTVSGASLSGSWEIGWASSSGVAPDLKTANVSSSSSYAIYESVYTAATTGTIWATIDNRTNTQLVDLYVARLGVYTTDKKDYVKTTVGPAGEASQVQIFLQQDATGGRTVSWGSRIVWENSATATLSTTGGMVDSVTIMSTDGGRYRATFNGKGWGA
jgi:hypothetical protein